MEHIGAANLLYFELIHMYQQLMMKGLDQSQNLCSVNLDF